MSSRHALNLAPRAIPPPRQPLRLLAACALPLAIAGCHHSPAIVSLPPAASAPPPIVAGNPSGRVPVPRQPPPTLPGPLDLGRPTSVETGLASWYGPPYHNHQAADGSVFDQNALTAAHRTLPLGTVVRVTNLVTDQSVVARITDRGPFIPGRTLDLSLAAARAIGIDRAGVARVQIEAFVPASADPAGRWCVQVGVFIDPADALQLRNDLSQRYTTARVIEFAGPTGHWVRINPASPDRQTAARIAASIHLPDAEPYLVRLN